MSLIENTRTQTPIRFRKARNDASLKALQAAIERKFGLPSDSVRLVRPDGRKMRSDAKVRTFRDAWE